MKKEIILRKHNSTDETAKKRVEIYCKQRNVVCSDLRITSTAITFTTYSKASYDELVNKLIAERYTIQDELAIQRKHQKGVNKAEFEEYDTYVEECKLRAKEFIEERNKVISNDN